MSKVWVVAGSKKVNATATDLLIDSEYVQNGEITAGIEDFVYEASSIFESKKIIIHSGYKKVDDAFFINDISLIELNRVIHFNDEIRPICLYDGTTEHLFSENESDQIELVVAGYGNTEDFNQAHYTLKSHTECIENVVDISNNQTASFQQTDLDTIICGQGKEDIFENKVRTCKGDSGGPLMIQTIEFISGRTSTRWNLVGLVSMGQENCEVERLGESTLFSNVHKQHIRTWIHDTITNTTETGTYCHQDRQIQCIKCNDGYKLNNQVCELEFSYAQMNSVHDFFTAEFCAEDCTTYMKIEPSTTNKWALNNGYDMEKLKQLANRGAYKSTYNNCTCEFGKPALRCPDEKREYCDPKGCNDFYHYDTRLQICKKNKCRCDGYFYEGYEAGTSGPAQKCEIHETQQCDCKQYYHHDAISGKCVENVCKGGGDKS